MMTEKLKPFCIGALVCAFVYGLILPFCWGNNPASEFGTLSLLWENRKIFFWMKLSGLHVIMQMRQNKQNKKGGL